MNLPAAVMSYSRPVFSERKQPGAAFEMGFWHDLVW